jgi:hypothetical protein
VTSRAFAVPSAARSVRNLMYELLSLAEPPFDSAPPAYPLPEPERTIPSAYAVYTRQFDGGVDVRRIPVSVDAAATAPEGWERHLAVDEQAWDLRLLHSAAILVTRERSGEKRDLDVLSRLPGADMRAGRWPRCETPAGSRCVTPAGSWIRCCWARRPGPYCAPARRRRRRSLSGWELGNRGYFSNGVDRQRSPSSRRRSRSTRKPPARCSTSRARCSSRRSPSWSPSCPARSARASRAGTS